MRPCHKGFEIKVTKSSICVAEPLPPVYKVKGDKRFKISAVTFEIT
jgi:hypothetical protein